MRKLLVPLFTALIITGAYVRIPIPPVPVTLQSLFIMTAALMLKPGEAASTAVLWVFLGAIGLPVFTSGGGIAALLGPTGGYIIGMALSLVAGSLMFRGKRSSIPFNLVDTLIMNLIIYTIGTLYLAHERNMGLTAALAAGVVPFLVGDAVKMAISSTLSPVLSKELEKYGKSEDE